MSFEMPEKILVLPQLTYPSGKPTGDYTALEFSKGEAGTRYIRADLLDTNLAVGQLRWAKWEENNEWEIVEVIGTYEDLIYVEGACNLADASEWSVIGPVVLPPPN